MFILRIISLLRTKRKNLSIVNVPHSLNSDKIALCKIARGIYHNLKYTLNMFITKGKISKMTWGLVVRKNTFIADKNA